MQLENQHLGLDRLTRNWGWYLVLGILLILTGTVAVLFPLVTTLISMVFFGWILLFSGIFQIVLSLQGRGWGGFFLHLLAGVLEVVCGILVLHNPIGSAEAVTLLITAYLMVGGIFRLFAALSLKFPGAGLIALSGFVSFILGLLILQQWPVSGLWLIGVCVGVDLLMHGATWVSFALRLKKRKLQAI